MAANVTNEHILDPDGDVVLVLSNPNQPFAVWTWAENPTSLITQDSRTARRHANQNPPFTPSQNNVGAFPAQSMNHDADPGASSVTQTHPSRYRMSSKHLMLASSYFSKHLKLPWSKTLKKEGNTVVIGIENFDQEAMITLMRVIHARGREIPRVLDLEAVAKIAVLADYFGCSTAVEFHGDAWLRRLHEALPIQRYNRNTILSLFSGIAFRSFDTFRDSCFGALWYSRGPIQTMGLPIQPALIDAIDKMRLRILHELALKIESIQAELSKMAPCGMEECMLIRHGKFRLHIQKQNITPKQLREARTGYSINGVIGVLSSMRGAKWETLLKWHKSATCGMGQTIQRHIESEYQVLEKLDTEGFFLKSVAL